MLEDAVVDDFLEHHGVKGMKWGVRNDRKSSGSSPKVRKAGGNEDLAAFAPLAAMGLALALTTSVSNTIQSGNGRRLTEKGKNFVTFRMSKNKDPFKKDPELAKDMSVDELYSKVVKPINKGYPHAIGSKMNCRRATFAYEMRRRGVDVAATRTTNSRGQDVFGVYNATHPGEKRMKGGTSGAIKMLRKERNQVDKPWTTKIQSGSLGENPLDLKDMHKGFSKMPPGSRGEMEISWKMGGLHSVAWENVHGNVVVFDTQNGRQYKNKKEINEMAKTLNGAGITRLDNKPLNNDYLMRWVKDAN